MIIIDSEAKRVISGFFFQEFCFQLLTLLITVRISESAVRAHGEKHTCDEGFNCNFSFLYRK